MIIWFVLSVCGASAGLGVFVIFLAVQNSQTKHRNNGGDRRANLSHSINIIAGPVAGVAIYFLTRWLLVAVVLGLVFTAVPALKSKQRLRRDERGLADAIATWTEQLRDTLAGAHGLEQAIVATSNHAPVAISSAVRRLSAQIQYGKLSDGLRRFADDVDHPIADFVSAALITATKYQARDLAQLLGHLAQCAREEGRMRTRIWVGRARTRSSVRIISFVVIGFVALLVIFNRDYLSVYSSLEGQIMLSCIFSGFRNCISDVGPVLTNRRTAKIYSSQRSFWHMIALILCGVFCGLGAFFLLRPGVLWGKAQQVHEQFQHAMVWLVRRSQVRHRADLAIVGNQASEMVIKKLTSLFVGLMFGFGIDIFFKFSGVNISKLLGAMIVMVAGVVGFFLPDSRVRVQATRRRQDFLHAFSSYLDLTNVLLAGGAGTETALIAAADAGDGWSFGEIRDALTRARSARRSPWVELANLGDSYNIPELAEVAGSVQLAGEHGARIRLSLSARAESLRNRQMGEIEAQAQAATERMGIPMVLLFIAFIALIGYPAVHLVLGSF